MTASDRRPLAGLRRAPSVPPCATEGLTNAEREKRTSFSSSGPGRTPALSPPAGQPATWAGEQAGRGSWGRAARHVRCIGRNRVHGAQWRAPGGGRAQARRGRRRDRRSLGARRRQLCRALRARVLSGHRCGPNGRGGRGSKNCGAELRRAADSRSTEIGWAVLPIFFRGAPKCETETLWVATAGGFGGTREVPAASGRFFVGGAAAVRRDGAVCPAPGCVGRRNRPYSAGAP